MTLPLLLTTDFSAYARRAYFPAVRLAQELGAPIRLLHVAQSPQEYTTAPLFGGNWLESDLQALRDRLEGEARRLRRRGVSVETVLCAGSPGKEIIEMAGECVGIALATHGYGGAKGRLFGSTATRIIREARTTLLTVGPAAKDGPVERVLVPIELLESPCDAVLDELWRMGRHPIQIELYHALIWPLFVRAEPALGDHVATPKSSVVLADAQKRLEALAAMVREGPARIGGGRVVIKATVTAVVEAAQRAPVAIADRIRAMDADLVIMSAHGTHGLTRLLVGSVTEEVIRRAACPVLTYPRVHAAVPHALEPHARGIHVASLA